MSLRRTELVRLEAAGWIVTSEGPWQRLAAALRLLRRTRRWSQ